MKTRSGMKSAALISVVVIILFTFAACSEGGVDNGEELSPLDSNVGNLALEEVSSRAVGYYPGEVSFQFVGQDKITDESNQDGFVDQECYLFDVIHESEKVSGVAVGTKDGSVWILDMYSEDLWLSESFMGLTESTGAAIARREPVFDLADWGESQSKTSMYFANIDTIPELTHLNEGSVQWDEEKKTLTLGATKGTGSVTGTMDGPHVEAVITWKSGGPELISVEYEPAPIFSHPTQVLASGEIMNIETDRLIEIGEYFRVLVQERLEDAE